MKETRLEEDAYIYKHKEETDEKKRWKALNRAEKIQYFKDYYLKKVLLTALVAGVAIWFLCSILAPEPEIDLYAAVINSSSPKEKEEAVKKKLSELLNSESEEAVAWDTTYFINLEEMDQGSFASIQRFGAQSYANMLDIVIADEEQFHYFARQGYFMDLAEVLPTNLYSRLSGQIYLDRTEEENSDGVTYGEETAYGVCLKDFVNFERIGTGIENPVLGIIVTSKKEKNGIEVLKYLTK